MGSNVVVALLTSFASLASAAKVNTINDKIQIAGAWTEGDALTSMAGQCHALGQDVTAVTVCGCHYKVIAHFSPSARSTLAMTTRSASAIATWLRTIARRTS